MVVVLAPRGGQSLSDYSERVRLEKEDAWRIREVSHAAPVPTLGPQFLKNDRARQPLAVDRFITRRLLQRVEPHVSGLIPYEYTETVRQTLWRCSVCHQEAWVDEGSTHYCCRKQNNANRI